MYRNVHEVLLEDKVYISENRIVSICQEILNHPCIQRISLFTVGLPQDL